MTIGDRLKWRLEKEDWSTRHFQGLVKSEAEEGARGVSYASVYEYVEGKMEPPISFLRAAANVLHVRTAWLAFGEEPMTEQERQAPDELPEGVDVEPRWLELIGCYAASSSRRSHDGARFHLRRPETRVGHHWERFSQPLPERLGGSPTP